MSADSDPADRLRAVAAAIHSLADSVDDGTATREHVDALVAELVGARQAAFGPRPRAARGAGARARILAYLTDHVGQVVTGDELREVAGIQEWARRVRELRVEAGYDISELGSSTYMLNSATSDAVGAAQWQTANQIRQQPGSARQRVGRFLEARVGEIVTREQIDYVANIAEGSRRVRELRDEAGWPIASHIDEAELQPGEYRLLSTDPADRREASQRLYPEQLRQRVFERDNYTCQTCGRDRAKATAAGDNRFYLEVHHKTAMADELAELPVEDRHAIGNLVTLCHSDHLTETAALHARKRGARSKRQP